MVIGTLIASAPVAAAQEHQQSTATPIKHFIFVMQASHTFDNYFGSYPGADGIPKNACQPLALASAGPRHPCIKPFAMTGRPIATLATNPAITAQQYDNGRMDGFVAAYRARNLGGRLAMGYYSQRALPFYWAIAHKYLLFDHFFSASMAGAPTNLSYWIAAAPPPSSAVRPPLPGQARQLTIFDRLQAADVSWKLYVQGYEPAHMRRSASGARATGRTAGLPLLNYRRFTGSRPLNRHIVGLDQYYQDLADGTLPAVSFIIGSAADDERSARTILSGQQLVRSLVTQLMLSRYWAESAFLLSYDGSGGHYDHVKPPRAGSVTLGFRVPTLMVSAYAPAGHVDHAVFSYGSALRFIEQNWHLAPLTRWDASAASLISAFDFASPPRPAAILPPLASSAAVAPLPARSVPVGLIYLLYLSAAATVVALVIRAASRPAEYARRIRTSDRASDRTGATAR